MRLQIRDEKTGGDLLLLSNEQGFYRQYFSRDRSNKRFTIAWNPGVVFMSQPAKVAAVIIDAAQSVSK